jgi:hypothetical protein
MQTHRRKAIVILGFAVSLIWISQGTTGAKKVGLEPIAT